jgi:glycosyltransferase involved in cell wall biosynthesis
MKTLVTYVPHGIDTKMFRPIVDGDPHYNTLLDEVKKIRGDNPNKFVVFWNNRNIHRKHPGDIVMAYHHLCERVDAAGGNAKESCLLVMHTQPVDGNGTDLTAVVRELCEYPVMFSDKTIPSDHLNVLYNVADVTLNIASNEGFGLGTAESIVAGTPIVVNVTGGLQDQCGFINPKTGKYFTPDDYIEVKTLHDRKKWSKLEHGEWVKPVWPSNISLQGSVPTPYIYDDRADFSETGDALYEWYLMTREQRKAAGLAGREFALRSDVGLNRDVMCKMAIDSMEGCFNAFVPRNRYELLEV